MRTHHKNKKKATRIISVVVIVGLIGIFLLGKSLLFASKISIYTTMVLHEGESLHDLYNDYLSSRQVRSIRWFLWKNKTIQNTLASVQPGKYIFSGEYSPQSFVDVLIAGPSQDSLTLTVLEGWSIYDIDDYLASHHYADPGDYVGYVSDPEIISSIALKYPFVQRFIDSKPQGGMVSSLEGLLYPDTYTLDIAKNIVYQLVSLQLRAFQSKVYEAYKTQIDSFSDILKSKGYSFGLDWYNIVTLASIIEKEEKNDNNKPTIAGIFLNRIENNMRIDADITLCYGLHKPYEYCTPSIIVKNISDTSNAYNTRTHIGLTPGPISNPAVSSFKALLQFHKTNYYYYLHSKDGSIYYGSSLEQHNANKKYL